MNRLVGKTIIECGQVDGEDGDEFVIKTRDGYTFRMYHMQDCCESVYIDDVCGDIGNLLSQPCLVAESRTNGSEEEHSDTITWTFYEFATIKGSVTITWRGESNGYYSEEVYLDVIEPPVGFTPVMYLDDGLFEL